LDKKIIAHKEKLKAAVYKAADLQATLSKKMAVVQHTLRTPSTVEVASQVVATAQKTTPIPPLPLDQRIHLNL